MPVFSIPKNCPCAKYQHFKFSHYFLIFSTLVGSTIHIVKGEHVYIDGDDDCRVSDNLGGVLWS